MVRKGSMVDLFLMCNLFSWNNREEMICDEAQLGPDEYAETMRRQELLQEQVTFPNLENTVLIIKVHISEAV